MHTEKFSTMLHPNRKRLVHIAVFVVLFGVCGATYLALSQGATPTAAVEAEAGTVAAPAAKINDGGASGGQAVRFGTVPTGTVLLDTTFDNFAVGAPMSVANYKTAMGDPNMLAGTSNLVNTSVVAVSGRGNVMRQTLIGGEYGSGKGIVTFPKLSQQVDEASIEYDIRFDSNFDWGWGGKLPGLGGAVAPTTPGTAAGCTTGNDQAWSGRGMWITPGSYGSVTGANEWIGYMYNYNKNDACGDNIRTAKALTRGTWHTVRQYYKLNTPGQANGVHRMWLDGVQVVNNTSFLYRNNSDLHINYMFWAIFRGGNTVDWAGDTTGTIDFDNLRITSP
jgi:hypothetical protein